VYNFEVALAFASLKTNEALAYARMIMDGTNPYEEFNWFKDFDASKLSDEVEELKNYDAALALAAADRMGEAYFVMKEVNIHKKLDPADFRKLDWSVAVRRLIDSAAEKYKALMAEEKKKKEIEYPEPSDNALILRDS
jgi:hypothetical protein